MANNLHILSAAQVMEMGLVFVGFSKEKEDRTAHHLLVQEFKAHYGCLPVDLAQMWYDLQTTAIQEAKIDENERNHKGFKYFMASNFFIWTHTKNASLLSSRFGISKRQIQSISFWKWIMRMGALIGEKVVWDEAKLGDDNYAIYIASVDGVDFNIWEKPSIRYNIDKGLCSHKSRHGAYRYLIALSVWESNCIYVDGPVPAGSVNDLAQFRQSLKAKVLALPPGKLIIADGGYQTSVPDEVGLFAIPNSHDPSELRTFKTRVRQRHETFNGRLKHFKILQDTFRFQKEKHGHVFRAVCVRVQYQMESGSPLFDP